MHVASGDLWAGAEVQVFQLLRALADNPGLEVVAVLLNQGELALRLRAAGIPVHVIDESQHPTWKVALELIRLVRKLRPHAVHTHRTKENILGAFAAALNGISISLRTTHGAPENTAQGLPLGGRLIRALDRWVGRYLQTKIVAVSAELQRRLSPVYGRGRLACILNGIDPQSVRALADAPCGLTLTGKLKIGLIGRLVTVKRIDLFLRTARVLLDRRLHDAQFYIVGDGPLRTALETLASDLKLTGVCHFLGFQSNALPVLKQLDALVLTSDHEGLPMVALEALALGVPVISHAVGGLPEVITSSEQGKLVKSQDPELFADSIVAAVTAPKHVRRNLLDSKFHIQFAAERYADLYKSLVKR